MNNLNSSANGQQSLPSSPNYQKSLPNGDSAAVLVEPIENRLNEDTARPEQQSSVEQPQDQYRSMIRELLRFDSRLSSLSSSCSSHPFTGVTVSHSTSSSATIELDEGRKERGSPTSVLLPEGKLNSEEHLMEQSSACKKQQQSGLQDKAYDYSNRILRYVTAIKVMMVIFLLGCTLLLFYFLNVDLTQTKAILTFILVWLGLVGYYLCIPTFKRWYNYWESQ